MDFTGDGPWHLPVEGFGVRHLTIGAFLVDLFAYGENGVVTQIRFEEPFELNDPTGRTHVLDPGQPWEPLAALFALRQVAIELVRVTKSWDLYIRFQSGHTITTSPRGRYDSWEIHLPDRTLIVGRAGPPMIFHDNQDIRPADPNSPRS